MSDSEDQLNDKDQLTDEQKCLKNLKKKNGKSEEELFLDKWKEFKKDKEIIDESKETIEKKIQEWEAEDLKQKWDDADTGIEYYPVDEFSKKNQDGEFIYADENGANLYENLKTKWNNDYLKPIWTKHHPNDQFDQKKVLDEFPNEKFDIEKASKKFPDEFNALKDKWQELHSNAIYEDKDRDIDVKITFDLWFPCPDAMIIAVSNKSQAEKKKFGQVTDFVAIGGLIGIVALVGFSIFCAGGNGCGVETITEITTDTQNGQAIVHNVTKTIPRNIPQSILESQFVIVLISLVIAPTFAKMLKEKYDIQIDESKVSMIMTDGLNSVKMYVKEANALRDKHGKLAEADQRKLRSLAFSSLASNYKPEKYKELVASVGSQVFEKAIEKAVEANKIERFPFEKTQVEAIITQAIDATPHIVSWQSLDPEMKENFIDGHVRRLLKNVGVEGWAYNVLENVFDAEVNKRLLGAAIADKNSLLQNLKKNDPLRLMGVVASTVADSIAKAPDAPKPTENEDNSK